MFVIRPVTPADLESLVELAAITGFGLTTLPHDREFLRRRIRQSQHAFEQVDDAAPRGETYLFVLEDMPTGRVVGTCGIVSKVGGFDPFYAYRVETEVISSEVLKVRKEIGTLHLVREHNGPSEIGSLFLHPAQRGGGNGWMLSLSRFLFMAEHRAYFDPVVIAEMRGVLDERGGSHFWDAIGRHFFDIDYPRADALSMLNKRFIADLMPRHPIYIALLPPEAQAVIGRVHPQTEPALKMLQEEGFRFGSMVDIFEGGPVVSCRLDEIRAVRQSVRTAVAEVTDEPLATPQHLIACTRRDARITRAPLQTVAGGGVRLNSAVALALGVRVGDHVRYVPMRAPPGETMETPPDAAEEPFHPRPLD